MRAVVFERYGPAEVLAIREVPLPVPKPHQVRVRVHAATVSAEDPKLRAFDHPPLLRLPIALLYGYPRPRVRVLGMELAGVVDAVGANVTRFSVGDAVFGYTGVQLGAHADYRCLPETALLAPKPGGVSFEAAASASNGALTALIYLRDMARLRAGEKVLVHGAAGAVGTAAVQIARLMGAHVTAVCSTGHLERVRALGADAVIDRTREPVWAGAQRYDVVFDTVHKATFRDAKAVLAPRGRFLVTQFSAADMVRMLWTKFTGGQRIIGGASNMHWKQSDLAWIAERLADGRLVSVVDRTFAPTEAALAHRYVEQGRKCGNVVLTFVPTQQDTQE